MALQETFRKVDQPAKNKERADVRKEAQDMVERHQRELKSLRENTNSSEAFREAALKATESFKEELQSFLASHGAEDIYEELIGFMTGKVSEILADKSSESPL